MSKLSTHQKQKNLTPEVDKRGLNPEEGRAVADRARNAPSSTVGALPLRFPRLQCILSAVDLFLGSAVMYQ